MNNTTTEGDLMNKDYIDYNNDSTTND